MHLAGVKTDIINLNKDRGILQKHSKNMTEDKNQKNKSKYLDRQDDICQTYYHALFIIKGS